MSVAVPAPTTRGVGPLAGHGRGRDRRRDPDRSGGPEHDVAGRRRARLPRAGRCGAGGFLELALVSSALLARAATLAGRPGGADAVAVWVVSATSGLLAGVHELVVTTPVGSSWSVEPGSVLAAAVRLVAPLVAAWLWERVLQAARAEQAHRTLDEVRGTGVCSRWLARRCACAAWTRPARSTRSAVRARRRLDRAHVAALRVAPPGRLPVGPTASGGPHRPGRSALPEGAGGLALGRLAGGVGRERATGLRHRALDGLPMRIAPSWVGYAHGPTLHRHTLGQVSDIRAMRRRVADHQPFPQDP
ncbi:hypothetical protein [Cellulomonas iranensis]|uniref:hypothetical protein n=1 Tax=Cellulomonas iranensis TaxID=76862 RepID=UPI003D7C5BD0